MGIEHRCFLCSSVGNKILDDASSALLCQEIEESGEVISCGKDGLPYLSQLEVNDIELFCDALQIPKEQSKHFQPTFCSTKCFQLVLGLVSIQLQLQKSLREVVVGILESYSIEQTQKIETCERNEIEDTIHKEIVSKWSEQYASLVKVERAAYLVSTSSSLVQSSSPSSQAGSPVRRARARVTKRGVRSIQQESILSTEQYQDAHQHPRKKKRKSEDLSSNPEYTSVVRARSLRIGKKESVTATTTYHPQQNNKTQKKKSVKEQKEKNPLKDCLSKCSICGMSFKKEEYHLLHMEHMHSVLTQDYSNHKDLNFYKCMYCGKSVRSASGFKSHQHSHIRKKPSACLVCEKVLSNDVDLFFHKRTHFGPFDCDGCCDSFETHEELANHQAQHGEVDGVKRCQVCDITFTKTSTLEQHMKVHPSLSTFNLFPCDLCGQIFGIKYYLDRHLALQHSSPEHQSKFDSLCHLCGKNFALKKVLLVHMKSHTNELRFRCKHCPELFPTNHARNQHQANVHEGALNIFKCNYCPETFTYLVASRRHMVQSHPEHTVTDPFPCQVCFRTFPVSALLQEHVKTHDRLTCKTCGKACGSKLRLEMHETIHTGERKFSCDICGKGFRHYNNVKCHKLEQHGDGGHRPWTCHHCPLKSYKRKQHLRFHLQREHGEDLPVKQKKMPLPSTNQGVV